MLCDPLLEPILDSTFAMLSSMPDVAAEMEVALANSGVSRFVGLIAIVVIAGVCFCYWTAGFFVRAAGNRTLRSLLHHTACAAMWFAFLYSYPWIAWHGKRLRLMEKTAQFEPIAQRLRESWPAQDGQITELGPFMAYPFGDPKTLVLLTPPAINGDHTAFSAVERTEQGGLRFLLSGREGGDWIEWHPDSVRPGSFIGGLGDRHAMVSWLSLDGGWYLVRYL